MRYNRTNLNYYKTTSKKTWCKLLNTGYQDVYVEIEDKLIKITILKKDANQSDANKVIKCVLEHLGEEYQVEVKFINE